MEVILDRVFKISLNPYLQTIKTYKLLLSGIFAARSDPTLFLKLQAFQAAPLE